VAYGGPVDGRKDVTETLTPPRVRLSANGIDLDTASIQVFVHGVTMPLRPKEFELLRCLMARPNEVLSRRWLADAVWGGHDESALTAVKIHIGRLRARLAAHAGPVGCVRTVRNAGYVFDVLAPPTGHGPGIDVRRGAVEMTGADGTAAAGPLSVSGVDLNVDGVQLRAGQRRSDLNVTQLRLFQVLLAHAGQVLSAQRIAAEVWGPDHAADRKLVTENITRARRHLRDVGVSDQLIRTVRGVGYVFDIVET
jgi:DNA-binding response OmpR family regulator